MEFKGKTSKRRPTSQYVTSQQVSDNWDLIYGKKDDKVEEVDKTVDDDKDDE